MKGHAPSTPDGLRVKHNSLNTLAIAVTLVASFGAMLLVFFWQSDETKASQQAIFATAQATAGACGLGSIEFHMPAETQARIRSECIKIPPAFDADMP